jgi:hypothetical protein
MGARSLPGAVHGYLWGLASFITSQAVDPAKRRPPDIIAKARGDLAPHLEPRTGPLLAGLFYIPQHYGPDAG